MPVSCLGPFPLTLRHHVVGKLKGHRLSATPCMIAEPCLKKTEGGKLLQVIEAALHCMKSNSAASTAALSALKPALASLVQAGSAIQHPGIPYLKLYHSFL